MEHIVRGNFNSLNNEPDRWFTAHPWISIKPQGRLEEASQTRRGGGGGGDSTGGVAIQTRFYLRIPLFGGTWLLNYYIPAIRAFCLEVPALKTPSSVFIKFTAAKAHARAATCKVIDKWR